MLSSAAVRSSAVPNVVTVLRNVSSCPSGAVQLQWHRDAAEVACLVETARVRLDLGKQRGQFGRAADRGLSSQPLDQVMAPLPEIADAWRQPFGVQRDA